MHHSIAKLIQHPNNQNKQYRLGAILQQSSKSIVTLATVEGTNHECVLKILYNARNAEDESSILTTAQSSNGGSVYVIQLFDFFHIAPEKTFYLEFPRLYDIALPRSEKNIVIYMKHLFQALEFIHSQDIIHRDVKPENIMVRKKRDIDTLVLCDFDVAISNEVYRSNFAGTYEYQSPEMIGQKDYSTSTDIWSAGAILVEMLLGHPLYHESILEYQNENGDKEDEDEDGDDEEEDEESKEERMADALVGFDVDKYLSKYQDDIPLHWHKVLAHSLCYRGRSSASELLQFEIFK